MDPLTFSNASLYNIGDILNLQATMDSFDDEDFESTMNLLDNAIASSPTSGFRGEDPDNLELNMAGISDAFNPQDTESPLSAGAQHSTNANASGGASSCFSPDLKTRSSGRIPVGSDVYIKQESNNNIPDLSPIMDSFLRESWDDIVDSGSRTARPIIISTTPGRINPLPFSLFLPDPSQGGQPLTKSMSFLASSLPPPPLAMRSVSDASISSSVSSTHSFRSKGTRRAKQCIAEGCTRRAQSNNRCKTHGGGARCQVEGCDKSSQGGGLCRAHGGGKKCRVPGCTKGTQRLGLCYLHGGIRRCITEGCKKKDRGNGFCISHGGGRRCETEGCNRSVRKGNHCQMHQTPTEEFAFQISRGQGLYS